MLKILAVLALLLACPAVAQAKTIKLGDPPAAEINVPDTGWTIDAEQGALEATAPDANAYVAADVYDAADIAEAGKATAHFILDQKIKVDPKSKVQKTVKVAGFPALEIAWTGTDPDGPTRFRVQFVKIKPDTLVVLMYWRSEAGETANGAAADAMMASLKALR